MRKFLLLIAQCSLLILFVSCSAYGFFWGQFGDEDVDERSPRLADFGTVDLSAQKQQVSSIYSFLEKENILNFITNKRLKITFTTPEIVR